MNTPVNYMTSGGSELIKSGVGYFFGYQVTSGSPLNAPQNVATVVAWFDSATGVGVTYRDMLAHARVAGTATQTFSPVWPLAYVRGLWLQVYSGSPVVTTSYS